jgi:hypothetical protein
MATAPIPELSGPPKQTPTKYELVINLTTARALLAPVDEVIE